MFEREKQDQWNVCVFAREILDHVGMTSVSLSDWPNVFYNVITSNLSRTYIRLNSARHSLNDVIVLKSTLLQSDDMISTLFIYVTLTDKALPHVTQEA